MDLGKTWKRISSPEVVVNDVYIDPRNSSHVLLATDRSGVLALNATGTWASSNHGYTHRYVTAIVPDQKDPNTIYVGVVNDREFGGVFFSRDNGQHWQQRSAGLGGKDVFTLRQASSGALVAGTNHGSYLLEHNGMEWHPINTVVVEKTATKTVKKKGSKKSTQVASRTVTKSTLDARVNEVDISGDRWMEATTNGLYFSKDQGKTWMGGPVQGEKEFLSVRGRGNTIVAAARTKVYVSHDNGTTFTERSMAQYVTSIRGITLTPEGQIFVASREGAFSSADSGATWSHVVAGLPDKDITSITFDSIANRLLATSLQTGVVFQSTDSGRSWQRGPDSGYPLRRVSVVHGRFVGATPFDGVVLQPENEGQSAAAGSGGASK
jgi:phosphoribosyl-AMP cyclohydrolase